MTPQYLLTLFEKESGRQHSRVLVAIIILSECGKKSSMIEEIQQAIRTGFEKDYSLEQIQNSCNWLVEQKALFRFGNGIYGPRALGHATKELLVESAQKHPERYMKFIRGSYSPNVSPTTS